MEPSSLERSSALLAGTLSDPKAKLDSAAAWMREEVTGLLICLDWERCTRPGWLCGRRRGLAGGVG